MIVVDNQIVSDIVGLKIIFEKKNELFAN